MTDLHLASQTTKKYDIPLTHLDYGYIEKCTSVKELEKILRVLRSGEEGKFPDLEKFAEKKLETLSPKNRLLRKDEPILRPGDLSGGDWQSIEQDLKNWTNDMHTRDQLKPNQVMKGQEIVGEGDENLPPIRSSNIVLEGKKQKKSSDSSKGKRTMPRDYKEWDKIDIDAELQKVDKSEEKKNAKKSSNVKGISPEIDASGFSHEERELKASREKDKGNEAYRSGDYEESVTYYSRSICLIPNAASFNNRALAYLKLEKWDDAIKDCNSVLNLEVDNIKALLRRGTAYKSKNQLGDARGDFEKVLKLETNNKKAESLLQEIGKAEKEKKDKGRRMVIEEVEEESEDEEEIEVEKPAVNGYSSYEEFNNSQNVSMNESGKRKKASDENHIEQEPVSGNSEPSVMNKRDPLMNVSGKDVNVTKSSIKEHPSPPPHPSTTQSFSPKAAPDVSPSAAIPSSDKTSALLQASDKSASSLSPLSSAPAQESLTQASTQAPALSQSSAGAENSSLFSSSASNEKAPEFVRPQLVQMPLSLAVSKLKEAGNNLFRSGQYGNAADVYSKAISILEKDPLQVVNLSLLLSNRAACHLKTGNSSQAISDCNLSLQHVPHGVKSLLRRAAARETLEKYAEAYKDYKHALSVDGSMDSAHQGATRCQNMLQQIYGPREWREKMPPLEFVQPWEVPLIVDQAGLHRSSSSSVSLSEQSQDTSAKTPSSAASVQSTHSPMPENASSKKPVVESQNAPPINKEVEFENLKASGNRHVQKGEFQEAAACYSKCISLCPEQVACYTNRALCYLKLNKGVEAEADCDKALTLQAQNPKALYRRALARKMLQRYKLSLQDLIELLKLEPKNTAAKKEMDTVKIFYKEELDKLKQKKVPEPEPKVKKRMKIEEVDEDEDDEKPTRGKVADKAKSQNKARVKSAQPASVQKSKPNQTNKQPTQPKDASVQGLPSAPRLMKTTPYEFCQAWNSLRPCQGIQPYAEILKQISPVNLPSVISNKLDGQMLQIIVRCVYEEMVMKGEVEQGYQILDNLCKVPRFSTVSMFMSSKEKKEVSSVLDILCKTNSNAYSKDDIVRLKKEFSVK